MSVEDKKKWDEKYIKTSELLEARPPSKLVKYAANYLKEGYALDLACGGGRHTIYLSKIGFNVDAIDISSVAIDSLSKKIDSSKVNLINADLDNYQFDKSYDLIVKTNFLDRGLIKRAIKVLKKDGIFVVETYLDDKDNQKPNSNPAFLLQKDELKDIFSKGFEILQYKEFWNEPYEKYRMKKAGIVALKL